MGNLKEAQQYTEHLIRNNNDNDNDNNNNADDDDNDDDDNNKQQVKKPQHTNKTIFLRCVLTGPATEIHYWRRLFKPISLERVAQSAFRVLVKLHDRPLLHRTLNLPILFFPFKTRH